MIKRIFNSKINSITSAAIIVAAASLASRFLGIFRDRILASEFGAGNVLDMYYAAFRVPDLVFNLLVLGALSAGFIPIFTQLCQSRVSFHFLCFGKKKCQDEAWYVANVVLNVLGVSLIVLSAIFVFFAPELMRLITPGFNGEKLATTVALTRIMFVAPFLLGLSSVIGGILQSFKRFFVYSLAPIMYNIGIIIGALYFVPLWGVYGLAYGVVLGALLHLIVQVPAAFSLGYRWQPVLTLKHPRVREIIRMMVPRTLSLAITQINLVVTTIIASTLAVGSLAVFNLANNLQSFPVGIFGISFAIAAFPTLAGYAASRELLIKNFSRVLRQIIFFILPATVLLLTLRAQIIRVILGAGAFGWEDTILTINTLTYFALSLFAQATLPLLVRMFYVQKNSKTPFVIGLIAAVVNIVLSWYFSRHFGVAGLALAFSIANIVNFALLWLMLKVDLGELDEWRILYATLKISFASIGAGLAVQVVKIAVEPYIDMTRFWGVFTQGFSAGVTGIIVFVLLAWLARSEELESFWRSIIAKTKREKIVTEDRGEARGI
jgi:putative peptidoglycan lipid II flippase